MNRLAPRFAAALLALTLLLAACGGGKDNESDEPAAIVSGLSTATATIVAAEPTPPTTDEGMPKPQVGSVLERVVVPKIGIDAQIETKGVNARGEMENPSGKDDVAWYDFSIFPGFGGNSVFSAHVDWFTGELGAFGRVRELKDGDEILFKLSDGMEMKYKVVESTTYESEKAPVREIVAPGEKDVVTFITCEGTFDRRSGDYSHRRIVRAERIA